MTLFYTANHKVGHKTKYRKNQIEHFQKNMFRFWNATNGEKNTRLQSKDEMNEHKVWRISFRNVEQVAKQVQHSV